MKKNMLYKIISAASSLLMFVAVFGIKPFCAGYMYQPKTPKCLK